MQEELNRFEGSSEISDCGFMKKKEKLTLDVKEVAKLLGIGINATYKLVKDPEFPSAILGGQYKTAESLLNEWFINKARRKF